MDTLNKKIANLEERLKQEVENNLALKEYTRSENLRFNNIEEKEHEDYRVALIPPKLDFKGSTELARRSMAGADQLLEDLSVGKTEPIKFSQ